MTTIYYKPARLAMWALLWGVSGGYTLFGWSDDDSTLDMIIGSVLLAMGVFAGYTAMDSRPALAGDANGLTVRTMFARRTVRWSELLLVTIERRNLRLWGIVPIMRRDYLSFMVQGGALGSKRMRLLGSWLALPPGGLARLRDTLLEARGAAGTTALCAAETPDGAAVGGGFDPDAAIARYLAAKATEPAASPARAVAPTPVAPARPRPSFGRRVA
jgi:hypothetical protein